MKVNNFHLQITSEDPDRLKSFYRDTVGLPNVDVLGPSPAYVPRIRGRWRWNVVIRGDDPTAILGDEPLPRGWTLDVDPISVL